jgi:uncharacterized protein YegL
MRKTVYILIDTSGSMTANGRSDAVNQAMSDIMNDVLPEVLRQKDAELEPSLAVLTFSSEAIDWYIPKIKMEDIQPDAWEPIERFYGGTPTGEAIAKVIEHIQTGYYGEPDPEAVAPAFLLLSDGMPTASEPSYEEVLEREKKEHPQYCAEFRRSNRIAIGINVDDDGRNSLLKFGRVSSSMQREGYQPYYDCTDNNKQALIDIIKSCTLALSIN